MRDLSIVNNSCDDILKKACDVIAEYMDDQVFGPYSEY